MMMYKYDIKERIAEEFERTYEKVIAKANETKTSTYLYFCVAGESIRISRSIEKHWDKAHLTVSGCHTGYYTRNRELLFHECDKTVSLLEVDPEKIKFIIEEQGYEPVRRQRVLPKKLREAIKELKNNQKKFPYPTDGENAFAA